MLGDESVGDIALGEGDFPSVAAPILPAVAQFSWDVSAFADFVWWDDAAPSFTWEQQ